MDRALHGSPATSPTEMPSESIHAIVGVLSLTDKVEDGKSMKNNQLNTSWKNQHYYALYVVIAHCHFKTQLMLSRYLQGAFINVRCLSSK